MTTREPCKWCQSTSCDCAERRGCSLAGQDGHRQCGKCAECDKPRFMCVDHQTKLAKVIS